jgi:DNA methylase/Restriction endonuclease
LERIIKASSNEGDVILDAYCGCGTSVAVAQRLNRAWIGIDITYQSIALILKRLEDTYGKDALANVTLSGMPQDFASAVALANKADDRVRKEFEKWAVLAFSNNRAMINEKKGGDGGIDGRALMLDRDETGKDFLADVLFSVKSDKTITPARLREFYGTLQREKAACGYFICLYPPNQNIYREVKQYGKYLNALFQQEYPVVEIITVEDILSGERIRIPASQRVEVLKSATKADKDANQLGLF